MEYTAAKISDQNLMYKITTTHNGEEITFNVICAKKKAELDDLVAHHLAFLNGDPIVYEAPQPVQPTKEELMAKLLEIQAQLEGLK